MIYIGLTPAGPDPGALQNLEAKYLYSVGASRYNVTGIMQESQLRELIGKGLPKILTAAITGVYPIGFVPQGVPSRDYLLDSQVVGNQLFYSKSIQVCSYITMDPGQILRLGHRAFPKYSRLDIPKMVISANGEALNTIMAKIGYLIGKLDGDGVVSTTPPMVINCSGRDSLVIPGGDSIFVNLVNIDISILFIASIQMV